jgi:hypothetical protein
MQPRARDEIATSIFQNRDSNKSNELHAALL